MSWIEIELHINNDILEQISSYLFAHGCEGINVTDQGIIVYFTTHRWSNEVKLGIIEYVAHVAPGFSAKNIQVKSITDHDWNADWKKHFKPVKITNRIVVQPPWEKHYKSRDELVITINPKMAFGTGHHESTKLVLVELEKILQPGMHVLDLGTGSGILAIAASKMGADSVLGIDNDMEAIKNANENLSLNKVSTGVQLGYAQLENISPSDYDIVLANINRNILQKYAPLLPAYLKINGRLILSGILRGDELRITQAFKEHGFVVKHRNAMKDWLVLVMELVYKQDDQSSD
jgi:ribosomal protein L11 methyltransferase